LRRPLSPCYFDPRSRRRHQDQQRAGRSQIDGDAIFDVATADLAGTGVTLTPVASIGHDLTDSLTGYVEPGIDLGLAGGGGTNAFVGVGLGHAITASWTVDAGRYVGEVPRMQVFAGLTYAR
jgi:hypothetical protein